MLAPLSFKLAPESFIPSLDEPPELKPPAPSLEERFATELLLLVYPLVDYCAILLAAIRTFYYRHSSAFTSEKSWTDIPDLGEY